MDSDKIKKGVKLILEGIGEDLQRPGIKDTPTRVAEMYEEIFAGLNSKAELTMLKPIAGESHDEMILIKDIPFYSVCEHHLLPFIGKAHIAYIPDGDIVGLSELAKALEHYAKRPSVQERLTTQLAELIVKKIKPKGAMVVIDAEHLCMSMRGIKKAGSRTMTSAVRGTFRTNAKTRDEMLSLIRMDS